MKKCKSKLTPKRLSRNNHPRKVVKRMFQLKKPRSPNQSKLSSQLNLHRSLRMRMRSLLLPKRLQLERKKWRKPKWWQNRIQMRNRLQNRNLKLWKNPLPKNLQLRWQLSQTQNNYRRSKRNQLEKLQRMWRLWLRKWLNLNHHHLSNHRNKSQWGKLLKKSKKFKRNRKHQVNNNPRNRSLKRK